MNDAAEENDWEMVERPKIGMYEKCKQRGYKLLRYYKKALIIYRIYRVVRVCIQLYVLYHTLMPNHFPLF